MDAASVIVLFLLLFFLFFVIFCFWLVYFIFSNVSLWIECRAAGLNVSFIDLLRLHFQKLNKQAVCSSLKILLKAGISVECREAEALLLAGGHLDKVTAAAVAADKAGLNIGFKEVAAIDLAGRDVVEAIDSHVNPRVLVCPERRGGAPRVLRAVARDGIELGITAQVTVKTRLDKLVGGAGLETIAARVGEGIIAAIGKATSHRDILEHPEIITRTILEKGLDTNTCFEILSVDVANIQVGDNVAVRLKSEQAEADKRIAQAKAAQRKANAVAAQQEMASLTMENQALLEQSKSALPVSIAAAFSADNMGSPRPLRPCIPSNMKWAAQE